MTDFLSGFFTWGKPKEPKIIKPERKPKKSKFNERVLLLKEEEEKEKLSQEEE